MQTVLVECASSLSSAGSSPQCSPILVRHRLSSIVRRPSISGSLLRANTSIREVAEESESGEERSDLASFLSRKASHRKSLPAHLRLGTMLTDTPPPPAKEPLPRQETPVKVLNGSPSYMHLLNGLNAWELARELQAALRLPAATAFNNIAPVGAAVATPLSKTEAQQCQVDDAMPLNSLATAYARTRGGIAEGSMMWLNKVELERHWIATIFLPSSTLSSATDRPASLGDFVALSDTLDLQTAKIVNRDVSDGVIAHDYEQPALELLCKKKHGTFVILKIDPSYKATEAEDRTVFGLRLKQKFQDCVISPKGFLDNIVTPNKDISEEGQRDLTVATLALKYSPGHTLVYAKDGQVIGIASGKEDNPDGSARLALHKAIIADTKSDFLAHFERPEKMFEKDVPKLFTEEERRNWVEKLKDVAISADIFSPFPPDFDDILSLGVAWVAASGLRKKADRMSIVCEEKGVVLCHSGLSPPSAASSSSSST